MAELLNPVEAGYVGSAKFTNNIHETKHRFVRWVSRQEAASLAVQHIQDLMKTEARVSHHVPYPGLDTVSRQVPALVCANYIHSDQGEDRQCPALICGTCVYPTDDTIPPVQALRTVMHGSSSGHLANIRANDCYGCVENLNHHHKMWVQVGITTTGEWLDKTKEHIHAYSEYLQVARTHTAAMARVGVSLQTVTPGPPMATMISQTGLHNILSPTIGALATK